MPVCAASGAPLRLCVHWPAAIASRKPRGTPSATGFSPPDICFARFVLRPLPPG
jgi:hypothetical protein